MNWSKLQEELALTLGVLDNPPPVQMTDDFLDLMDTPFIVVHTSRPHPEIQLNRLVTVVGTHPEEPDYTTEETVAHWVPGYRTIKGEWAEFNYRAVALGVAHRILEHRVSEAQDKRSREA